MEAELLNIAATAVAIDDHPSCVCYPRGNGIVGVPFPENNKGTAIEVRFDLEFITPRAN